MAHVDRLVADRLALQVGGYGEDPKTVPVEDFPAGRDVVVVHRAARGIQMVA